MGGLWQSLLPAAPIFNFSLHVFMMLLSACKCFRPLFVVLPNILPSIVSHGSESCLKMCSVHLSLHCCTASKILLALSVHFVLNFFIRYPVYPADLTLFSFSPTLQKLIIFLYQLGHAWVIVHVSAP